MLALVPVEKLLRGRLVPVVGGGGHPAEFGVLAAPPLDRDAAQALYVALLTDTGGFRFANTTPRCHAVAAQLLAAGLEPEEIYRRVYASVPPGKLHLLREALATLDVDPALGTARQVCERMMAAGVLAKDTHGQTVRIAPPIVIERDDLEHALDVLAESLAA